MLHREVVLKRAHACNDAAVSLGFGVKNNDPALHPRPAGIGKLEVAAGDDGRRGWKPELARMRRRKTRPRPCRPEGWGTVVVYMRLRVMDQAEAGDQNDVQSRLDYMCPEVHDALNDALRWSWPRIGYSLVERSGFNNTKFILLATALLAWLGSR